MIYNFLFPFQKSSRYGPPPPQSRLLMKCEILKLNQASIEDVELWTGQCWYLFCKFHLTQKSRVPLSQCSGKHAGHLHLRFSLSEEKLDWSVGLCNPVIKWETDWASCLCSPIISPPRSGRVWALFQVNLFIFRI